MTAAAAVAEVLSFLNVILNIVLERKYKESPVLQLNHLQLATYYLSAFKIQLGGLTIKLVHFAKQIFC